MKRLWLAVLVALLVAFVATPAFAQGGDDDGRVVFGQSVTIESGEVVRGDLVVFGGSLFIEGEGRVRGDAVVFGGSVDISGRVDGSVVALGGAVRLTSTAQVGRDVVTAGGTVDRDEGARIGGQIVEGLDVSRFFGRAPLSFEVTPRTQGNVLLAWLWRIVRGVITALAMAALGLLVVLLLPEHTRLVGQTVVKAPVASLGVGVVSALALPLLLALLVITCIGIPVAFVLVLAVVAASLFGWIAISLVIGERILGALNVKAGEMSALVGVAVGSLLLSLLTAVPCLGFLLFLAVGMWGLGAVALTRFGTRPYQVVAVAVAPGPPVPVAPPMPPMPAEPEVEETTEPEPEAGEEA